MLFAMAYICNNFCSNHTICVKYESRKNVLRNYLPQEYEYRDDSLLVNDNINNIDRLKQKLKMG